MIKSHYQNAILLYHIDSFNKRKQYPYYNPLMLNTETLFQPLDLNVNASLGTASHEYNSQVL
jgi:hypothetical protein